VNPLLRNLYDWYAENRRALPWREDRDAYHVWVSEIMLQQTRVETVLAWYRPFLDRFPDVATLASAPVDDVLKAWEGLGYYARARNLHRAAGIVVESHGGAFPDRLETAAALPGLGRSTAGAVLSIAYGRAEPVLDGNVGRVVTRLNDLHEDPKGPAAWGLARRLVLDSDDPGLHNQAMMELGALVCRPRRPACGPCPARRQCLAFAAGTVSVLPIRERRRPIPHLDVCVGILEEDGRIFVQRRPDRGLLGGMWELPGGKREEGEAPDVTVQREMREELGLDVEVGRQLVRVEHAYTHFTVTLHAFQCRRLAGEPVARVATDWKWATPDDLAGLAIPRATRKVLERIGLEGEGR
jgi:A/G-specific adenine glycosylase